MKIAKPYLPTISVDVQSAQWIANRLDDFADWPGITKSRAKRLVSMAKHLRKLCGESAKAKSVTPTKTAPNMDVGDAVIKAIDNGVRNMLSKEHSDSYWEFDHALKEIEKEWEAIKLQIIA